MLLDGRQLADFVTTRHIQAVRNMRGTPRLAIIQCGKDSATASYVRVKQRYGDEIGARVDVHRVEQPMILPLLKQLNADATVNGIIVQLPLTNPDETDTVIAAIDPAKDVDGLHPNSLHTAATPMAILWLLAGYNIEVKGRVVVVVGQGRLVGAPLSKLLEDAGSTVIRCDKRTSDLRKETLKADIIISATGVPGLIKPDMVKVGAALVDAGAGEANGAVAGDLDPALIADKGLKVTPNPGGVGPMTVVALFENLIQAARAQTN